MPIASNLSSGRITARYILGVVDGPDPDDEPDLIPASGTVKFVPKTPYLVNVTADPAPMIALPAEVVGILDGEGYLCTPDPADPSKPGSTRGVRLFATDDPDGGVTGWTWEATPRLITPAGITLAGAIPTTAFTLPSGATLDLATLTKVPSSPGVGTDQAITLIVDLERRLEAGEFGGGGGEPVPGKSAYELAVDNGFTGTLAEWLESLKGPAGSDSTKPGPAGKSAYQLAVDAGFSGTQAEWLESLKGADGKASTEAGPAGKSAYQIAVEAGFAGTQAQWLESLRGPAGPVAGAKVTASTTAPTNPAVGDVWLDISA